MLRKSELFSDLPSNSCLQYRLIRAASKERFKVAREHCEDLWRTSETVFHGGRKRRKEIRDGNNRKHSNQALKEAMTKTFQRTPFASRLLRHAMRDRARRETGFPASSTSPMFDDWRKGIHAWIRQQTDDLVGEGGIRLHDHIAAVNSSMAFGFNLFMPFREYGVSALEEMLGRSVGFPIRVIDIEFEFQGPTDVLAECAGPQPTDDEKFTASDVAVHVEDDNGRAGLVLVEVKLSEGGFTPCNGAKSTANRRKDVCASAARFFDDPRACYLRRTRHAQRDRRYWDIFDAAFGSVRAAVPGFTGERCPFEGNHQQLMRNHALALGLMQAGEMAFTAFGLVHHPDNHHVVEPWEHYRSLVSDPSLLFRIPANELIDAAADQSTPWLDWACYMRERYMLATGIIHQASQTQTLPHLYNPLNRDGYTPLFHWYNQASQ